jgi:maltooligosyltrehalose trehalohydrolase
MNRKYAHGAWYEQAYCRFRLWGPQLTRPLLLLEDVPVRAIEMVRDDLGYWEAVVRDIAPGTRYRYRPAGKEAFPDPASFFQPEGVHGASKVIDHRYDWTDGDWNGLPFPELILYELHVGSFTPQGTFDAIIPRLQELASLGINAIELMPVAQFPGSRNWGYDGVYPYAVQESYGGPMALKRLVDSCHRHGIAVFLDVVYNHLGPEGNYLERFGPYFTDSYRTPWGKAVNLDGEWSDGVRDYFCDNIAYWHEQYHIDGLRIDAVHTMYDNGAVHFWEHVQQRVTALRLKTGRLFHLIAEADINSPRIVSPAETGGYGFDAMWLDDFHHALYVLLDPAGQDRYEDFGGMDQLIKAFNEGFVHSGEYVRFRKRKHGRSSAAVVPERFIAFNQNHDQVGNRLNGERLSVLLSPALLRVAAAALLLSPYIPLLFMGEEYGEDAPFLYFVSHSEARLIDAVRAGRREEFKRFNGSGESPDPQAAQTFKRSLIRWENRQSGIHRALLLWYRDLISLRRRHSATRNTHRGGTKAMVCGQKQFMLHRTSMDSTSQLLCLFNLDEQPAYCLKPLAGRWKKILDSETDHRHEAENIVCESYQEEMILLPAASVLIYELQPT